MCHKPHKFVLCMAMASMIHINDPPLQLRNWSVGVIENDKLHVQCVCHKLKRFTVYNRGGFNRIADIQGEVLCWSDDFYYNLISIRTCDLRYFILKKKVNSTVWDNDNNADMHKCRTFNVRDLHRLVCCVKASIYYNSIIQGENKRVPKETPKRISSSLCNFAPKTDIMRSHLYNSHATTQHVVCLRLRLYLGHSSFSSFVTNHRPHVWSYLYMYIHFGTGRNSHPTTSTQSTRQHQSYSSGARRRVWRKSKSMFMCEAQLFTFPFQHTTLIHAHATVPLLVRSLASRTSLWWSYQCDCLSCV